VCFLGYELVRRVRLLQPLFGLARDPQPPIAMPRFSAPQDIN
jgi:hypothetical protein